VSAVRYELGFYIPKDYIFIIADVKNDVIMRRVLYSGVNNYAVPSVRRILPLMH
jgi:hypothetical protein